MSLSTKMKHLHSITHVRWRWTSLSSSKSIPWLHLSSLLLILLSYNTQYTQAFCPSKCQCVGTDANTKAYCSDAALEDVPIQLNPETKYINLTMNKIRNIEFTLPFYMKLEILDLSRNIIETLGSKNFEYQTEMRTLNLSHNLVSSLQKDAFKGLTNLLVLDLSFNRIDQVVPTAMNDLSLLIELDLTNNNILSLEDNTFRNLVSLEILIFKNNQLLDVPANNLQHLHSLKSLDLSDNLVEYVRNDSFEGLRELVTLSLRGNVISELDLSAFEGLITLKHMDLADNNLTMVPTQQLSKLSNLTHLTLSGNSFTHLPAVGFLNLFHLRELHLNRLNFLQRIDSRAFVDNTHLQILYLNNNPLLSDIPMRMFQGNPNILEVHMQANSLQTLYAAQFPIDQLEKLYLGDNPLQCNCTLFWLWRLVTGNFENGQQTGETKPDNMMTHEAGSVAALGADMNSETDDNLVRVAAYVAERKKDVSKKYQYTNPPANPNTGYLKLDTERIGCEIWHDSRRTRKHLAAMTEGEITCPAHVVTIVCAVLTCLLVVMTGASIIFYMRFVKRRRKLMHDRSLRTGKSIVNVHDRILPHQPLSAQANGGIAGTLMSGAYPHHTLQSQRSTLPHNHNMHPLHHQDYHQTLPQVDKLELERYLTAQAIANEYRALKPWELPPVKDSNTYTDEPEHLYEKFDHYEYPDAHSISKTTNGKHMMNTHTTHSGSKLLGGNGGVGVGVGSMGSMGGSVVGGGGGTLNKPHIVYV